MRGGRRAGRGGAMAVALAVGVSACDEPLAVVGDIPGIMRIVAGMPDLSGNTTDPLATASRLDDPVGLAIGDEGVLFVADQRNARVVSVTSSGRMGVLIDHSRCTTEPCLERPAGLALDGSGGLLVADPVGHRIWRIDIAAGLPTVIAGTGEQGTTPDGASAAGSPVTSPLGIAVGAGGIIYFSERLAHRIRTIRPDGTLGTLGGTGEAGFAGDGGPAADAALNLPAGLALAQGWLYVADASNDRVRVIDLASGGIGTAAGSGVRGFGGDGGPAVEAAMDVPEDVAVTLDGCTLYIADTRNHRVRTVRLTTGVITTFAGTGDPAFNGDLLAAGATSLRLPRGLAASPFGLLFLADTGHEVVWRVAVEF
ncbi:MAG: hypothetical protein ACE5JR_05510 [Gemmatimonadota bacterium]